MNNSRRFFIKAGISLAALALMWGCNSEQTQTQVPDLEIVEYEDFKIEYDRKNLVANFILKNDKGVVIVSKHSNDGRVLSTPEGETILVLAYGHNEYKSPPQTKIGFGKDEEGNSLISLLPSHY
ncbi:MAG: hypothetical protein LBB59_00875 [Campylobacteraceae bacterium]|jgi:hypothetical protein|nr:hypothetical protein [Campylobacteraceae bacterium]